MSRLLSEFKRATSGPGSNRKNPFDHYARIAEQAARTGGRILKELLGKAAVREKAPKDVVTEADTLSQRLIREILLNAFPDHQFVGEEDPQPFHWERSSGKARPTESGPFRWVVDPLDGTANYAKGLPGFAVSIGLEREGEVLVGVVFDPLLGECFVATKDGGAFLNGQRLKVSSCRELERAMVVASFPPNVDRSSPDIPRFTSLLTTCHSLRRLGSAALNLCYLAAGRVDAYWSTGCKVWDVAAGVRIVQEAGGVVTDLHGGPLDLAKPVFAASANSELHEAFLKLLAGETPDAAAK